MYDCVVAMKEDIQEYIKENAEADDERWEDRDKLESELYDDLFCDDSVTGNASGSYTFSSAKALEYLVDDGFEHVRDMVEEFGVDEKTLADHICDWEWFDVSIRCYLLSSVLSDVLDDLYAKREEAEQNEI